MKEISVDGFIRDNFNEGSLINTDNDALKAYKLLKQKHNKMTQTSNEVNELKKEVSDIKHMLALILEKIK